MGLFKLENFTAHSGKVLPWKIECDALTDDDWRCLANVAWKLAASDQVPGTLLPSEVVGVPRGGLKLAAAMEQSRAWSGGGLRLVVDDVLTTGGSMRVAMDRPDDVGLVVFARGPLPPRVVALFTLAEAVR